MPPPAEALQLKAAFGEAAFARLKTAKNRYRDGDGLDAQGFLTVFYALAEENDGLAARADSLLGLVTALLPPAKRGALRDPTLRGRARSTVSAPVSSGQQELRVILKSLLHPPVELQLRREQRVEHLRAQVCVGAHCSATQQLFCAF